MRNGKAWSSFYLINANSLCLACVLVCHKGLLGTSFLLCFLSISRPAESYIKRRKPVPSLFVISANGCYSHNVAARCPASHSHYISKQTFCNANRRGAKLMSDWANSTCKIPAQHPKNAGPLENSIIVFLTPLLLFATEPFHLLFPQM